MMNQSSRFEPIGKSVEDTSEFYGKSPKQQQNRLEIILKNFLRLDSRIKNIHIKL